MNKYKRILVAVDLSGASDVVMETALELGRALQSELHVIHVHKIHAGNLTEGGNLDAATPAFREVEKLEHKLDKYIAQYADAGIAMTTGVYSGEPYLEIIQAAEKTGANMIIMGTHGRTGVAYLVLGSVAENVLRHARVPVMSIRCHGR